MSDDDRPRPPYDPIADLEAQGFPVNELSDEQTDLLQHLSRHEVAALVSMNNKVKVLGGAEFRPVLDAAGRMSY